jgi:glyoxylase-like metal-dependent hydrolase (beta-lactamase superfamily II)
MTKPAEAARPLSVTVVPVTAFQQNASIVVCTATKKAAIVDPGGDIDRLMAALAKTGATAEKIVLTHGHIDHAGGAADLAARLSIPVEGPHEADRMLLDNLAAQARLFGVDDVRAVTPDRWLSEGETLHVGALVFDVLHVPGHTPGHLVYVHKPSDFALVGDTLFRGSVGRTDFPYGDGALLIRSINEKMIPLGDQVVCLPGHGPATTIGDERRSNPFL